MLKLILNQKLKKKTNQRIETRTDEGIEKGLDKVEEGVGSIFKKKEKKEKTEEIQTTEQTTTSQTQPKAEDKPKFASYSKYDFIQGNKSYFMMILMMHKQETFR